MSKNAKSQQGFLKKVLGRWERPYSLRGWSMEDTQDFHSFSRAGFWKMWRILFPIYLLLALCVSSRLDAAVLSAAGIAWFISAIGSRSTALTHLYSGIGVASRLGVLGQITRIGTIFSLEQAREQEVELPMTEAFDRCIAALSTIPRCHIKSVDVIDGQIRAARRKGLIFQDPISIDLKEAHDGLTKVSVRSKSTADWLFLSDDGANLENVLTVMMALESPVDIDSDLSKLFRKPSALVPAGLIAACTGVVLGLGYFVYPEFMTSMETRNAKSLIAQGKFEAAAAQFSKTIKRKPADANLYLRRGEAHLQAGNFKLALADFNKAEDLTDDDGKLFEIYANRAHVYVADNKPDAAIDECKEALSWNGYKFRTSVAKAYGSLGLAYAAKGQTDSAIDALTAAINMDIEYIPALEKRAALYKQIGKKDEAASDIEAIADHKPQPAWPDYGIPLLLGGIVIAGAIQLIELFRKSVGAEKV